MPLVSSRRAAFPSCCWFSAAPKFRTQAACLSLSPRQLNARMETPACGVPVANQMLLLKSQQNPVVFCAHRAVRNSQKRRVSASAPKMRRRFWSDGPTRACWTHTGHFREAARLDQIDREHPPWRVGRFLNRTPETRPLLKLPHPNRTHGAADQ